MSDFYTKGTKSGFYETSLATEPNMREEMNNTLLGSHPEIAKARTIAYRKMRTEENGSLTNCACVDVLTKEPDKDYFCPICLGEGFLWDESLIGTYKIVLSATRQEDLISAGLVNLPTVSFYFSYDLSPVVYKDTPRDKIVEIALADDGQPIRPYRRSRVNRIHSAIPFRSDNGKLEYWKLNCTGEQTKFLNGPNG